MINTATTVATWMYRGSSFTVPVSLLDEEGVATTLQEGDSAHLRLFYDNVDPTLLLEKEAAMLYEDLGLIVFELEPEDTAELLEQSYTMSVHIKRDEAIFPVLVSKLGIVAFNPAVIEEEEE